MEVPVQMYRCEFIILSLLCLFVPCFCETVEVWEGESVVLPCPGPQSSSHHDVHWCKFNNNNCRAVLSSIFTENRIGKPWSTAGVDLINSTSLKILSVLYSRDNGRFRCRVYPSSKTYQVVLNVLVPVETITVTGPENPVSENKVVSFSCLATGGRPAPVFKWYIDDTKDPALIVYKQDDHRSNVKFTPTRTLNNKTIRCEASVRNKSVFEETTIYVTYKPTVIIAYEKAEHSEGDSFDLYCWVEANPPADVTWFFKTKTVNNNVYRIASFDQSQTGTYKCSATNREGTATDSIVLALKRKPASRDIESEANGTLNRILIFTAIGLGGLGVLGVLLSCVHRIIKKSAAPPLAMINTGVLLQNGFGTAAQSVIAVALAACLLVAGFSSWRCLRSPEAEQGRDEPYDDAIELSALPDMPAPQLNRENQVDVPEESPFSEDDHYDKIGHLDDDSDRDSEYPPGFVDEGYLNPYSRRVVSFTREGGPYNIIGGWDGKRRTRSMMELDPIQLWEPTDDASHRRRTN